MKLTHIELDNLKPAKVNVRKHGAKAVDDLLPSIRSLGLIQPLLVRSNCEGFEVVAGQRRYHALVRLATEHDGDSAEPVPCIIMDESDDATAIEASLAENVARLPMDEVDQYRAFAALVKAGSGVADIASQFGVTERLVTQRLAVANLIAPVLSAYRNEEIDPGTIRILTMATKAQQKKWMELFRSDEHYAPTGRNLKHWLFGGATIPVTNALFDAETSGLVVIGDLFGEDRYFADSEAFWPLQSAAVAELAEEHRANGWQQIIVHEIGAHWPSWNYAKVSKEDGGEIHITIAADGKVTIHAGLLDHDTLRKRNKAAESQDTAPVKPEITKAMQNYLALHRHAAVRADVLANSDIALRLVAAHIIAGSSLWSIETEPQRADKETTVESLVANPAQKAFEAERDAVAKLLGIDPGEAISCQGGAWHRGRDLVGIFEVLRGLSDTEVTRILTFVMAETLETDTAMIEHLGVILGTDMTRTWQTDDAFFDLVRDKEAINAMLWEVGGKQVADANVTATAKVQKSIIRQYLDGTRESGKPDWQPRYASFPMKAYTKRGGIRGVDYWTQIKTHHG